MIKKNDLAVYTCSVHGYDNISLMQTATPGIHFIFFTNNPKIAPRGWEARPLQSPARLTGGNDINRYHKLFPHHVLPEYNYSIYLDGNITYNGDFLKIANQLKNANIALAAFAHPNARQLNEEVAACELHNKFDSRDKTRVIRQLANYESEGLDINQKITANYFLVRDHSHDNFDLCMSLWWSHLFEYAKRDQLSLSYALWKSNLSWAFLDKQLAIDPHLLSRHSHAPKTAIKKIKLFFSKHKKN